MKPYRIAAPLAAIAALALASSSAAVAQREAPEQRIDRLEKQLRQIQHQLFPRGAPADSAGFSDEPAATQSSVRNLDDRLATLERQLSEILRASEENGHRLGTVEAELARLRSDQEQRIVALEQRAAPAPVVTVIGEPVTAPAPQPALPAPRARPQTSAVIAPPPSAADSTALAADPGEDAYSQGFRLWQAGNYSQAILALRSFTAAFPKHHRVSWANNLVGRALLDSGQPRPAAEALLANYRGNPSGERAADSLYYLGQALMKLNQPAQACKAYAELDSVYGATIRPDLKKLEASAKSDARCS